ncbi:MULTISPECIES: DUF2474 domain-containing protein [Pantoea]|uniref:DUF2474 domain-containing protein n=1 Tax=Candidatus Pantoea multigeneris TaxID=2608357 RepID=A0ABX0REI6_9GAMM|nr:MULTISPECIES: DUF2474 domain-containing protein [Pantoea]NIF23149.1 DUF2474 domain-containing protein [Pantoea multigeneris]
MQFKVGMMKTETQPKSPWWQRILWLMVIYSASVLALAGVAWIFRLMMSAAGMRTH